MSAANVLPSVPPQGVETTQQYAQLYPNLPCTTTIAEISQIETEQMADEVDHYRLKLKKYKKIRKVIHYSAAGLGGATLGVYTGADISSIGKYRPQRQAI